MGICSSSSPDDGNSPGNADMAQPAARNAPAWDANFPAMSRADLIKKRKEFWETRVTGGAEIWQTLRMAAEADDQETGRVICESAGISPYEVSGDVCHCYDERGQKYEVPMYVLSDPSNLIQDQHGDAGVRQTDDEKAEPVVLSFKVRLSNGQQDMELEMPGHLSVLKLKEEIRARTRIPVEKQKVILHGQLLKDNESLFQKIKDHSLVQVMVRG